MKAPSASRATSLSDTWLTAADNALKTLSGAGRAGRPMPTAPTSEQPLSEEAKALSGALMRVNHVGEVCAQALYNAQALTTRDPQLQAHFREAAREETDHLAWTSQRLTELGARPSLLNPLWYAGSFSIGWLAGMAGRRLSLGFVVETERQVEQHLESHLQRLPGNDLASRAVVQQMKADEGRHADQAESAGGARLPKPLQWAMQIASKVMTTTAHRI